MKKSHNVTKESDNLTRAWQIGDYSRALLMALASCMGRIRAFGFVLLVIGGVGFGPGFGFPVRADSDSPLYAVESGGSLHVAPDVRSPAIFPLDIGRKLIVLEHRGEWIRARDGLTGLIGWVIPQFLGPDLPAEVAELTTHNRTIEFEAFKERFNQLSQSISDVTGYTPFRRVEHMGGGAARVFADPGWYQSRRSEQQAFRIFNMWKAANAGQPVVLSFSDDQGTERFIVLDGPNRPRLLTAQTE